MSVKRNHAPCPRCGTGMERKHLSTMIAPSPWHCDRCDVWYTDAFLAGQEALLQEEGCLCGKCGRRYRVDVLVPDALWPSIAGRTELLCPRCIAEGLEALGEFAAFRLVDVEDAPAARSLSERSGAEDLAEQAPPTATPRERVEYVIAVRDSHGLRYPLVYGSAKVAWEFVEHYRPDSLADEELWVEERRSVRQSPPAPQEEGG